MVNPTYTISYDIGTTGVKTCRRRGARPRRVVGSNGQEHPHRNEEEQDR